MPTDVAPNSEYHRWMITGHPGVGKTVLAASSPNALIARSPMDQVDSILSMGYSAKQEIVRTWGDMHDLFEYLRHEDHGFEWVWLDTTSLVQDVLLHSIMEDLVTEKPHRNLYVPDKAEYQQNMNRMKAWVRDVVSLPVNFGMTAHPNRVEDEDDDTVLYYPWIQGRNMPQTLCGYMKLVGYLTVVETKEGDERRVLITTQRDKYYAKDNYGALGGRVADPTVPKIVKKIEEKTNRKKTTRKKTSRKKTTSRR